VVTGPGAALCFSAGVELLARGRLLAHFGLWYRQLVLRRTKTHKDTDNFL
jgi:hypothetical protein